MKKTIVSKNRKSWMFSTVLLVCIVCGLVIAVNYNNIVINNAVVETKTDEKGKLIIAVGEYSLPSGESGWLEIFAHTHSATPVSTYGENNSATLEASSLAYADTDDWNDDLVSDTAFDIVVRCRFNKTHTWDSGAGNFNGDRARVYINTTGDVALSGANMSKVITGNNTAWEFIYVNFYLDNGGSGYTIPDDGTITVSTIDIEAKF